MVIIIWVLRASDVWKIILQVACFSKASLWSVRNMNTVFVIADWFVNDLVSSHLGSWWNVCGSVFMITWWLIFLLSMSSIVHLVFVRINISTSWVNWWSLITSFSACWWLSWIPCNILLPWNHSWWWQVSISWCFTLVMVSLCWYLGATVDRLLDSQISFALKSGWRSFSLVLLTKFAKINGTLLDFILCDGGKVVSFLEILNSLWFCVRNDVSVFQIELLECIGRLNSHACWSYELSVLILSFWKSLSDLSEISWASDCLQ